MLPHVLDGRSVPERAIRPAGNAPPRGVNGPPEERRAARLAEGAATAHFSRTMRATLVPNGVESRAK